MAVTWTITNRRDALVDIHPALQAIPPQGTTSYAGAYRAIRCTAASTGTYVAGGDTDFVAKVGAAGIKHVEAVLLITEGAPAVAAAFPRFQAAAGANQSKMLFYVLTTGAELGAVSAAGTFEILVLGRSG